MIGFDAMRKPVDDWKCWDEPCFDCATKRGWKRYISRQDTPFPCVHRTDLEGKQLLCAGAKKVLERWKQK